jgi:hypothetical protein
MRSTSFIIVGVGETELKYDKNKMINYKLGRVGD